MPLSGKSLLEVTVTDIIIKKKNEVYVTVKAEPHINQELSDLFTFDVPGAKFMPQYRSTVSYTHLTLPTSLAV